jgi:hypothetical protein
MNTCSSKKSAKWSCLPSIAGGRNPWVADPPQTCYTNTLQLATQSLFDASIYIKQPSCEYADRDTGPFSIDRDAARSRCPSAQPREIRQDHFRHPPFPPPSVTNSILMRNYPCPAVVPLNHFLFPFKSSLHYRGGRCESLWTAGVFACENNSCTECWVRKSTPSFPYALESHRVSMAAYRYHRSLTTTNVLRSFVQGAWHFGRYCQPDLNPTLNVVAKQREQYIAETALASHNAVPGPRQSHSAEQTQPATIGQGHRCHGVH